MKMRTVAILAAGLLLAGSSLLLAMEETAPDFALEDLEGNSVSLSSYKGKVLILNFWATWCPPCREEIPDFIKAYEEYKSEGLEILGVSVDRITQKKLGDWVAKARINYPIVIATPKMVMDYEPGDYIPATIVIDREGLIRYRHVGLMDKETLIRLFKTYSD